MRRVLSEPCFWVLRRGGRGGGRCQQPGSTGNRAPGNTSAAGKPRCSWAAAHPHSKPTSWSRPSRRALKMLHSPRAIVVTPQIADPSQAPLSHPEMGSSLDFPAWCGDAQMLDGIGKSLRRPSWIHLCPSLQRRTRGGPIWKALALEEAQESAAPGGSCCSNSGGLSALRTPPLHPIPESSLPKAACCTLAHQGDFLMNLSSLPGTSHLILPLKLVVCRGKKRMMKTSGFVTDIRPQLHSSVSPSLQGWRVGPESKPLEGP